MRPIQTKYKGYRFRSRLEAKWAVFMDALDLEWEYEKEGFDLGNGIYYLPDFYLPHLPHAKGRGCWIEVKGKTYKRGRNPKLTQKEIEKAQRLAVQSGITVYAMSRLFPYELRGPLDDLEMEGSNWRFSPDGSSWDGGYNWGGKDGEIGIWFMPEDVPRKVLTAFEKARGARFEFGESGA